MNPPSAPPTAAPYGSWPSAISASMLTQGAVGLVDLWVDGEDTYWLESRPSEAGRLQIVVLGADGARRDVLPDGYSARSSVHEYGGGAALVCGGVVWFTNWADQRVYRLAVDAEPGVAPLALTPAPPAPRSVRFADFRLSGDGRHLVCVRETHHGDHDVVNELVVLAADVPAEPVVVVSGPDFVSSPRFVGADRIRWVQWADPNMPWDETSLCEAGFADGAITAPATLASGHSFVQPLGEIVMSDADGYWNPWVITAAAQRNLLRVDEDLAGPPWAFGGRDFAVTDDGRLVTVSGSTVRVDWLDAAASFDGDESRRSAVFTVESVELRSLVSTGAGGTAGATVTAIASFADREDAVVRFTVDDPTTFTVLQPGRDLAERFGISAAAVSIGEHIEFPTSGDGRAYGWFYPPASETFEGLPGERPPLIVMIHGGPTAAARPGFGLAKQFWTSRGFAIVDVDYRGSTGYGRAFRQLLNGQWGLADVDDCCAAAQWLAAERVDPARLLIRGGSAGGFTVLAALSGRDVFSAGASYYGIADLAALAEETHKFEARYTDVLIAPWPQHADVYQARSPINHVDGFRVPLIVFQGADDKVVPPNQSEMIVAALRAKNIPCEYHLYPGEGHGFRRADTIEDSIEAELCFYRQVCGIDASSA